MKICIIGGGIAGLVAAYELSNKGHKIELYEQNSYLGGQASTFDIAGTRLEGFYHHIFTNDTHLIKLIEELGLKQEMEWLPSKVAFFYKDKIYDFVTPMDLLRFSPLSLSNRIRLGLTSLYLRSKTDWRKLEQITAKKWIIDHAGRQNYDVVWGPLLNGKFGERAGEVSMAWFWNKIRLRFGSRKGKQEYLGYMKGSYARLIDVVVQRLKENGVKILSSRRVTRIAETQGNVSWIEYGSKENNILEKSRCDAAIATISTNDFLKIAPDMPADYVSKLSKINYVSALCLVMMLNRPFSRIYWLNISAPKMPFVAVIEHTNFVNSNVYQGKHIVYISNYLNKTNPLYECDASTLLKEYLPYLRMISPQFDPSWVEQSWLFKEDAAQPIVTVGYSKYVPEQQTPIKGLYLANTAQIYPEDRGMNYSVRLGQSVSQLVAQGT